jgi:hypothetical protein
MNLLTSTRMTSAAIGLALLVMSTPMLQRTASAATLAVPEDYATIGDALAAATAGDFVLVGCGTYRERNLQVKAGVSLWSATLQPDCVTIDAQGRGRVLMFDACDTTTAVVGLTLRGGVTSNDGGAILCRDAAPRIARCRIEDSQARRGGGLASLGNRGPVLEDCVIAGNSATEHGGGIFWNVGGSSRLSRCTISGNTATVGGGLAMTDAGNLLIEHGSIVENTAGSLGGGIWIADGGLELRDSILARNAGGLGGSALASQSARPRLLGCTVVDNVADHSGPAIHLGAGASLLGERLLLAFNSQAAVGGDQAASIDLSHCNIHGHRDGDWAGPLADLAGRRGNFSADPRFCDRADGVYSLQSGSPCLPGGRPGAAGALVGARSRGCP